MPDHPATCACEGTGRVEGQGWGPIGVYMESEPCNGASTEPFTVRDAAALAGVTALLTGGIWGAMQLLTIVSFA